ncbi:hypothetical protein PLESTF_000694600 [Pleodorina starrii]|nr:hypothetical protein PLESTF_000694600 [Pleodorina starrii]
MAPPCPRFVRRDPTMAPPSIFKPPAQQRFNLVVPTSLIERNFDMNAVLQCGLKVVFKRLSRGDSQPAEALDPVHGCVSRHVNPIGLTSYRVSGAQPAGVGTGCALQGWSVEDGRLVVEVASRQQQQQQQQEVQDSAPAPARRLFGDCLPSPATIRKQRPPRDDCPQQEQEEPQPQPQMPAEGSQSPPRQCGRFPLVPAPAPAATVLAPIQPPTKCMGAWQSSAAGVSGVVVAAAADLTPAGCCQVQTSYSMPTSDSSDAGCGSDHVPHHYNRRFILRVLPQACPKLSRTSRQASRQSSQSSRDEPRVATPPAQRPKRHRPPPSATTKHNAGNAEAAWQKPMTLHAGIDLLLAAHMALSQQENGRPKRVRRPNSLFVQ